MLKLVVVAFIIHVASSELACPKINDKTVPSAEKLYACKEYSCSSCCSAETTKQIALKPLQTVGSLNFSQCDQVISDACSTTFSQMLCFFKCSPNIYSFYEENLRTFREKVPLCPWFCNRWFETCRNDKTCTLSQNWLSGFQTVNNTSSCYPANEGKCSNFSEVYDNGEDMCNFLFGQVFEYTDDEVNCFDPFQVQHNVEMINERNPGAETIYCEDHVTSYTDAGTIVGIVFGVLLGLFVIVLLVALYMKRKQGKDGKNKAKEGTSEELRTMNKTASPAAANDSDFENA